MTMYGADADELDRLAAEFRNAADELDNQSQRLTSYVYNVTWVGGVATNFLGEWTGKQLPQVRVSTAFLRQASETLIYQAAEQRFTSGEGPHPAVTLLAYKLESFAGDGGADALGGGGDVDIFDMLGLAAQLGGNGVTFYEAFVKTKSPTGLDITGGSLAAGGAVFGVTALLARLTGHNDLALAYEGFGHGTNLAGAGVGIAQAVDASKKAASAASAASGAANTASKVVSMSTKLGGAFAIAGGVVTMISEGVEIAETGMDAESGLNAAGGLLATAGGIAMLVPGGQVVGAVLLAGSAVAQGSAWVVENWDEISEFTGDAVDAVGDFTEDAGEAIGDFAQDAGDAIGDFAEDAGDVISGGLAQLGGLFS